MTESADIFDRIEVDGRFGCFLYVGKLDKHGYGPYVTAFERTFGVKIPRGANVEHICRRRSCIQPLHLEVVTVGENQARQRSRWHRRHVERCPAGHRFIDETRLETPEGGFVCALCLSES